MRADETTRRFSRLLHDLTGLFKVLNRDEKLCYGLTWPQAFTIETLAQGGPLAMGGLGERMGAMESTATRIVNLLVRDGLVERTAGERDRRQVLIALTARGQAMAKRLVECREQAIAELLAPLSAARRRGLVAALETIKDALAGGTACCPGKGE